MLILIATLNLIFNDKLNYKKHYCVCKRYKLSVDENFLPFACSPIIELVENAGSY